VFAVRMLGVTDTCPHFMCFGHVPGRIELLEVETYARLSARPRVIGPAVGDCFWVQVAKSNGATDPIHRLVLGMYHISCFHQYRLLVLPDVGNTIH
jgi:hypothetical protein